MSLDICIHQGKSPQTFADVNVVIDVLRAFTVSYYAFKKGVSDIFFVGSEEQAFELKRLNPEWVLAGEKGAYKIAGFDLGNSPFEIMNAPLKEKFLVQKTTNGVAITLNSLNADHVFVTGFINAKTLANHLKTLQNSSAKSKFKINLIASHPTGKEDLACAMYLKNQILYDNLSDGSKEEEKVVHSTLESEAAKKFLNASEKRLSIMDLVLSCVNENSDFVMKIDSTKFPLRLFKMTCSCLK